MIRRITGAGHTPRNQLVPMTSTGHALDASGAGARPGVDGPPDGGAALRRYLEVVRDRWLTVTAIFVVIAGGVAVGSLLREPAYRSTATIEIRKQAAEVVPVDALFQYERISDQYLQTEYATLRSKVLLERALAADTALTGRLAAALGSEPAEAANSLADRAHDGVDIDPVTGSRVVRVSFESPDPQLSADVVNGMIAQYTAMRQEAGAEALARIGRQADSVRADILVAERELLAFVRRSGLGALVIGGRAGETVPQERLRQLQQELTEAETEVYRASALATTGNAEPAAALESDLLRSLRARIAELEGERARLQATFTENYPRVKQLQTEVARLESMLAAEQRRVGRSLGTQQQAADGRLELLRRAVARQQQLMTTHAVQLAEYERRSRDITAQTELYAVLQQKQKEAALASSMAAMDIGVLDAAAPSSRPVRPQPARDIPLGVLAGLLLGLAVAFLREYLDGSVKTPEDTEAFEGVPLLALIPSTPLRLNGRAAALPAGQGAAGWHRIDQPGVHQRNPQLAEAFRGLRTSVLFDAGGELPRTLLVTSSVPGEGKTTVSSNLAISMAMMGRRVLLVDADMRRPALHRVFGVERGPGVADLLTGHASWTAVLHRDVSHGLDLVAAGTSNANPSDILSSASLGRWLADVAPVYDLVVIDAPALHINAPDGRILAHAVEGVVLVARSRATSRDVVRRLVAQTPNLVGIVLNRLDPRRLTSYYGDYGEPAPVEGVVGAVGPRGNTWLGGHAPYTRNPGVAAGGYSGTHPLKSEPQ